MMEINWEKVEKHLGEVEEAYSAIPPESGAFALSVISEYRQRFCEGERTDLLARDIFGMEM